MSLFLLKRGTAILTVMAVSAAPLAAVAQNTDTQAQVQVQLPAALSVQGLSDVKTSPARRGGTRVTGKLPDGSSFRAMLTQDGKLAMVGSRDAALPQAMLDEILPATVRGADMISRFSKIHAVMQADGRGTMVMGKNAEGESIRAGFDPDGKLSHFSRGDHDRKGRKGWGKGGHRWGKHGGKDGDRHGDYHKGARLGDGIPGQPPAPMSEDALRKVAEGAGYTALGAISYEGPRSVIEAINPQGEAVTVEIAPNGKVMRETAR